jgi:hypothetical protein
LASIIKINAISALLKARKKVKEKLTKLGGPEER